MRSILKFALMAWGLCLTVSGTCAQQWVATWATAPQLVEPHNLAPEPGLAGNSLRQIVQVSIGGSQMRLTLTNEFSRDSTEILGIEVAKAMSSGSSYAIDENSSKAVTFSGSKQITIAGGQMATSDAIDFSLQPRQNVAITIHYGKCSDKVVTGHPGSRTTSYLTAGNTSDFGKSVPTNHWYNLRRISVLTDASACAVAVLGNSITDGRGSTTNEQDRWPDMLSRALLANKSTSKVGVLNLGIGGNCVLAGGLGPTGVSRFQRDCLDQPGVKYVILFEGINDLGNSRDGVQTAQGLIKAFRQMIRQCHEQGVWVYGATITPFKNNNYYSEHHEAGRQLFNEWVRNGGEFDGIIDFDRLVRSSKDPASLDERFLFENDYLHPNAAGYRLMGESVDLKMFVRKGKSL